MADEDEAVVAEVVVAAPIERVFAMFTEPEELVRWIGIRALLEPRPGGVFRFELMEGEFCSGRYVAVEPPSRVVFTWGYDSGAMPVAPGSSTVEVVLSERGGGTHVLLTHTGLSEAMRPWHADGWNRFLPRLAEVCAA
jgi:uncharacterized protein YndB with AHSA1/START domain